MAERQSLIQESSFAQILRIFPVQSTAFFFKHDCDQLFLIHFAQSLLKFSITLVIDMYMYHVRRL